MRELQNAIEMLERAPKVKIKGKDYTQVAVRVEAFRQHFGTEWAITTEILPAETPLVRVRAEIRNPADRVVATGTAEENRTWGNINKTSAIENCETSAIGRALANLGLHGGEFATAEEVDGAIKQQEAAKADKSLRAKTQIESDLRAFAREMHGTTDSSEFHGVLEAYKDVLEEGRNRADTKGWFRTKPGSDKIGLDDQIEVKRIELERAGAEEPVLMP